MAVPLAVGDILQTRFVSYLSPQLGQVVRHYRVSGITLVPPTDQDAADQLDATFRPLIRAVLCIAASYRGTGVQRLRPLPKTVEVHSSAAAAAGLDAADPLPMQTAGLISLRTAIAGKANRGRSYLPFPSINANNLSGHPAILYLAALDTLAVALTQQQTITVLGGAATLDPVIFHRGTGTGTVIVSRKTNSSWATQRRRGDLGRTNVVPF
jgi:hypothetical protein